MASGLENIETIESPFRRFVTTIGVFPTAFTDAMTYYECLAYLVKYLEDSVVPAVNENAEALKELQDYVVHYFENLDVQEEINNKLDQMAEDGTLQEIITAYIQANVAWTFDTVAEMKTATNLIAGSYARTLGFYTLNDGGGATYYITDSGTADEKTVIAVGDLFANIVYNGVIKPEQLGCKCDENYDDAPYIQDCIDISKSLGIKVEFAHDTYFIRTMINIPSHYSIDFQGVTLKAMYALEDGIINVKNAPNEHNGTLSNVILDQNLITPYGLYIYRAYRRTYQDITFVKTPTNGYAIYITTAPNTTGGGNLFTNIKGNTTALNTTFAYVNTADNTFTNIDYQNYITGFEITRFTRLYDIHGYIYSDTTPSVIDRYTDSYFIKLLDPGCIQADNLYPDTQEFVIYTESTRPSTIGSLFYTFNDNVSQEDLPIEVFKAKDDDVLSYFYRFHVNTVQLTISSARLFELVKNTTRNPLATTIRIDNIYATNPKTHNVPPTFVDYVLGIENFTKLGVYGNMLIAKGTSPYATTSANRKICKLNKYSMCQLLDGYYPIVCKDTNNNVFNGICQVISNEVYIEPNASQTANYQFEVSIPVQLASIQG